ncbi:hypothetical protein Tco_0799896 [Tanacetum coccineum]|uniref:Uncharacterized protein n=1 Tax=Tanacetum coccineum TaxID=301880 RepID=A0ABQ4ZVS0_9ASTR
MIVQIWARSGFDEIEGFFGWEELDRDGERGFDYLTFALVSSKAHLEGVGLRVADSHTANHPEGGFTPLKTIRRLLVVIGKRSHSGFEGEAFNPETRVRHQAPQSNVMYTSMYVLLSTIIHKQDRRPCFEMQTLNSETHLPRAKELNEFLSFYPIPSEYDAILPTSTQTIFDAPPDYVSLYTHSFSLANLRLPLTDFFCEIIREIWDGIPQDSKTCKVFRYSACKLDILLANYVDIPPAVYDIPWK